MNTSVLYTYFPFVPFSITYKRGENQKSSWSASWCACSTILLHILRLYRSWSFTAFRSWNWHKCMICQQHRWSTLLDRSYTDIFCSHALANQCNQGDEFMTSDLFARSSAPSPTSMFSRNRLNVNVLSNQGWRIHCADDSLWYDYQNIQYFLWVDVSEKLKSDHYVSSCYTTQHL